VVIRRRRMLVHLVPRRMKRLLVMILMLSLGHEQPRAAIVRGVVGGTRIVVAVVPQRPPGGRGRGRRRRRRRRRRRTAGACGSTVRRLLGMLPRSGVDGLLLLAVVPRVRVHGSTVSISASRSSGSRTDVRERTRRRWSRPVPLSEQSSSLRVISNASFDRSFAAAPCYGACSLLEVRRRPARGRTVGADPIFSWRFPLLNVMWRREGIMDFSRHFCVWIFASSKGEAPNLNFHIPIPRPHTLTRSL
jgi:hypothetical protein